MNYITINEFADLCGVDKEAIRYHIAKDNIKAKGKHPTLIDADKYEVFISFMAAKAKKRVKKA